MISSTLPTLQAPELAALLFLFTVLPMGASCGSVALYFHGRSFLVAVMALIWTLFASASVGLWVYAYTVHGVPNDVNEWLPFLWMVAIVLNILAPVALAGYNLGWFKNDKKS